MIEDLDEDSLERPVSAGRNGTRAMSEDQPQDLLDPELYINRELSLLEFNRRVLAQAKDESIPLLERLRFLTISSSNLDEFFEVRAASHKERVNYGAPTRTVDGRTSHETLSAISKATRALVKDQYRTLNETLLPALEAENIRLLRRAQWSDEISTWIRRYFRREVLPVLTPMGLDPAHPFPRILNKSLNFVILVSGEDAYARESQIAVVQVPRPLPRLIQIPKKIGGGRHDYVMLSSVMHANIEELFPGMSTRGCYQFRVTRDGELWVDEEEVDDYLKALQGELPERKYSEAVRLEVADECPDEVCQFLLDNFELNQGDLYRVHGPVNLHRLAALHDAVDRPDLKYEPFAPRIPRRAMRGENLFDAIDEADILLHHPYESFAPVLELARQAASDPDVLAIKQTLYRTERDSQMVEALIDAASKGKQVTVVVELRARFDEQVNIDFAMRLQDAGAIVVYGISGFKTHAKMMMIVRRVGGELRRYVHLGTGNYHAGTARAYTDVGFLTANPVFGEDVDKVFTQLTGLGGARELKRLLQSPFTLHKTLVQMIDAEAQAAREGKPAGIKAKMNALTEPMVIQALYRASRAGVPIELVIRGACCLRPGIPGVSENIRVRSILGRFLEHSRLYWFHAGGEERLYCSSADWMTRNLVRRVETCFPIEDAGIRRRLCREGIDIHLEPDVQAWMLRSSGSYDRVVAPDGRPLRDSQQVLLDQIKLSDDTQLEPDSAQATGLLLDVRAGERMGLEPSRRKGKSKNRSRDKKRRPGKDKSASVATKTNGKPKQDR